MSDTLYFNETVKNPAIVFSTSTMRVIKVGDVSYMESYYQQMISALQNVSEEKLASMKASAEALGLSEQDMLNTIQEMQNEYQYLEIPKDDALLKRISTQAGLRDYLVEQGRLIIMDDETDLQEALNKRIN